MCRPVLYSKWIVQIYVEGRLQTRLLGRPSKVNTRYMTEVVANNFQFLGSRGGGGGDSGGGDSQDGPSDFGGGPDAGDLPFE